MKVLIPDHYSDKQIQQIRDISSEIEIIILRRSKEYFIRKGIWWLSRNYLPYSSYKKWRVELDAALQKNWYIVNANDEKDLWKQIEVFLCSAAINQNIFRECLHKLTSLKWIHSSHTGVDHLLSEGLIGSDIALTNIGNINSRRVAEFVIALVLYGSKNLPIHRELQQKVKWHGVSSREFGETTLGILGLGNIGQDVARMAARLNMKVVATKRNPIEMNNVTVLPPEEYHEVLKIADYVIITLPLTKDTKGIIGEKELRIMHEKACLINVSRGNIVQEEALIKALREKWIAGAYLDVFSDEPLTKNSPFYTLRNVLITHHSSYASRNSMEQIFGVFLENLGRYVNGSPMLNSVNKERGY
jgi:D-2-hydroxyacid dehydrogenase (NADP+)